MSIHWKNLVYFACLSAAAVSPGLAAEIHSNGRGGGDWIDPDTWHAGQVPTAEDIVVVAMRDTVRLGGKDSQGAECKQIYIDPEGVLTLAAGQNPLSLTVSGPIESYGTLRIDGTKSSRGTIELQLTGGTAAERTIRLLENSSLLAYGRKDLPENSRNVLITAPSVEGSQTGLPAVIIAEGDAMVDLHHTLLSDVVVQASLIDNTGSHANQRLNVIGNHFVGFSRLVLAGCDTPSVHDNHFDAQDAKLNEPAMLFNGCKLADIRANRIDGSYGTGIQVQSDVDSSAARNVITGPARGIYWHGSNAMLQDNTIASATDGLSLNSATGVVENTRIEKVKQAVVVASSNVQLTTCRVDELTEGGVAMSLNASAVRLLNSNIGDDQIKVAGAPPGGAPAVEAMQYLVVRVTGQRPPGTKVQVQTAQVSGGVPQGKADLNVRNAPAPLGSSGQTPPPASPKALVVRSWRIGADGKKENAPFYDVIASAPSPAPDQPAKALVSQVVEPSDSWARSDPNDPTPNVELKLP